MDYKLLKSRTFWTVIAMFLVGGMNAIVPVLSPSLQTIVMAVLTVLASLFHFDTAAKAGAVN